MGGPAWLGIGAQRCGTTWLADLLCQHPRVSVPANGRKEQHELYRGLFVPWGHDRVSRYRRRFDTEDASMRVGECTPYYLRALWAPAAASQSLDDDVPLWAILRDPVERFESAMRYWLTMNGIEDVASVGAKWIRNRADRALWGGMYASHLDAWTRMFGADRITVLQYEQVRQDPQPYVDDLWRRMGLDPVPLEDVAARSRTSSRVRDWSLDDLPGLREQLRRTFRDEVERLAAFGMDPDLWPNFRMA